MYIQAQTTTDELQQLSMTAAELEESIRSAAIEKCNGVEIDIQVEVEVIPTREEFKMFIDAVSKGARNG